MTQRKIALIAGGSYLIIFFAAIFANFFVLEALIKDPLATIQEHNLMVRFGILAFMITVVFDIIVAWALFELFKGHLLSRLSSYFRLMHAALMGAGIYTLPLLFDLSTKEEILHQITVFNTLWLIGLFFFGIHLIMLSVILKTPKIIAVFLIVAGVMYMLDTSAHFLLTNYEAYSDVFLMLVAIPSVLGELSLAIWLLTKGGK